MGVFIIRRLVLAVIVLFIVTILTFSLIQIMPGDPALIILGQEASPEQIEALRQELWLDQPATIQYFHWLGNAVKGDFGTSVNYKDSILRLIATRLPITLYLAFLSTILSIILGIGAGIICATRRGSFLDGIISFSANMGIAIPTFWLGILGIYLFSLKLGWLPIQGFTSPFTDLSQNLKQIIMPVICLAIPGIAVLARQTRSSLLEVIKQDYIRTAWAKGLRERVIIIRHALKNALIPIVTILGLQIRIVVGGSVIIETIFNIPGMGRLMVNSIFNKDFAVVQACTLWIAPVVLVANLIVDISYGWLDPRVRFD
jgi:peptide/nickel transport system permease protein